MDIDTYAMAPTLVTSLAVFLVGLIPSVILYIRHPEERGNVAALSCLLIGVVVSMAAVTAWGIRGNAAREERKAEMSATYGILFSAGDYVALNFPYWDKPSQSKEVYGTAYGNIGDERVQVQLVWQDGAYHLLKFGQGNKLVPLPESKHAANA